MASVTKSIDDYIDLKKSVGTKLPRKVSKLMGGGWQPPREEADLENDLMKDPFLQPRFEAKPKAMFTRSKVICNKEFEL